MKKKKHHADLMEENLIETIQQKKKEDLMEMKKAPWEFGLSPLNTTAVADIISGTWLDDGDKFVFINTNVPGERAGFVTGETPDGDGGLWLSYIGYRARDYLHPRASTLVDSMIAISQADLYDHPQCELNQIIHDAHQSVVQRDKESPMKTNSAIHLE